MATDADDCHYTWVYYYDEANCLRVRAQAQRTCVPPVFFLGIILGVIAAIVIGGLLLLLAWKTIVNIHDRREFARFEKDRMMARWDTVSQQKFISECLITRKIDKICRSLTKFRKAKFSWNCKLLNFS